MVDEQIFLLFSVNEGGGLQESLTRNFHAWCKWAEMLIAKVPERPWATGQAAGPSMQKHLPGSEMKGLFTKYTWQYRMASPISSAMIDEWTKSQAILIPELLKFFQGGDFDIDKDDLKRTPIYNNGDVDWNSWCWESPSCAAFETRIGSSMLVPVSFNHSAVDEYYFAASPRCVSQHFATCLENSSPLRKSKRLG